MTELELQNILRTILEGDTDWESALASEGCDEEITLRGVSTFEEVGLLTRDSGIVVRLSDGSEFQVTIVRSR